MSKTTAAVKATPADHTPVPAASTPGVKPPANAPGTPGGPRPPIQPQRRPQKRRSASTAWAAL